MVTLRTPVLSISTCCAGAGCAFQPPTPAISSANTGAEGRRDARPFELADDAGHPAGGISGSIPMRVPLLGSFFIGSPLFAGSICTVETLDALARVAGCPGPARRPTSCRSGPSTGRANAVPGPPLPATWRWARVVCARNVNGAATPKAISGRAAAVTSSGRQAAAGRNPSSPAIPVSPPVAPGHTSPHAAHPDRSCGFQARSRPRTRGS